MKNTIIKNILIGYLCLCFGYLYAKDYYLSQKTIIDPFTIEGIEIDIEENIEGKTLEEQIEILNNIYSDLLELEETLSYFNIPNDNNIITNLSLVQEKVLNRVEEKEKELRDSKKIYLGNFSLTAYCPCKKCCGPNAQGVTATGTKATPNRTIAVDPRVIPYGSTVEIEGLGIFIAEDCGGGIKKNRIDVFYNTHEEALNSGVNLHPYRVFLIKD